jgi:transcriptional regulatory protein RtcR
VAAEIAALRTMWRGSSSTVSSVGDLCDQVLPAETAALLDRFDRVQLEDVLAACHASPSLSAAGRLLFDRSRVRKQSVNDADRLRKYLARFGLEWQSVKAALPHR